MAPSAAVSYVPDSLRSCLAGTATANIDLTIADEAMRPGRGAFAVTSIFPGGWRVYQHIILHLRGARIARQVDAKAWD
jgi:hypothetical protein